MDDVPAGRPGYFLERSRLSERYSAFACAPECSRPGCKSLQMQVPVTLHDILAAALASDQSVVDVFRRHYCVGLTQFGPHESIFRVTLKVQKPCPWLRNELCSIYPIRPLACILFPESHILAGTFHLLARQWDSCDYACFGTEQVISRERAGVVRTLRGLLQRELLVSESWLLGSSPFLVDLTELASDLYDRGGMAGKAPADIGNGAYPSLMDLDAAFREQSCRCSPFLELEQKLVALEDIKARRELFEPLANKRRLRQLQGRFDGSQHVFKFDRGALKRKRMSLIPPECSFM